MRHSWPKKNFTIRSYLVNLQTSQSVCNNKTPNLNPHSLQKIQILNQKSERQFINH